MPSSAAFVQRVRGQLSAAIGQLQLLVTLPPLVVTACFHGQCKGGALLQVVFLHIFACQLASDVLCPASARSSLSDMKRPIWVYLPHRTCEVFEDRSVQAPVSR